jgi:hypothetical protein
MTVTIVTATRMDESEFWSNSALGQSLQRLNINKERLIISFSNTQGLPTIYNKALATPGCAEMVVFVHDDVWIDDIFFCEKISEGLDLFDVFGIIGNKICRPMQPAWCFVDRSLTWDSRDNFIGGIAHGDFPFGKVQRFQDFKGPCALIDGVLIAARRSKLIEHQICFDERFDFNFYDADFSRTVAKVGLRLGVYPISLTHQSIGVFGGNDWGSNYIEYARKWNAFAEETTDDFVTPPHDHYNPDLLALMSDDYNRVVEIGCSRGALAKAYLESFHCNDYVGIELDAASADAARLHCTRVIQEDVESLSDSLWDSLFPSCLWIFGDSLEHLRDPWSVLKRLRSKIDLEARVIACLPNAQHWSVQARLSTGDFHYEQQGLLDRTHLRWFTRKTSVHLFESCGFAVESITPRILDEPERDAFLPAIQQLALMGVKDARNAVNDSIPLQYVIVARPV